MKDSTPSNVSLWVKKEEPHAKPLDRDLHADVCIVGAGIAGLSVALALVIAQGLFLAPSEAWPALLYATCGALTQAIWSLLVWVFLDRAAGEGGSGWSAAAA